MSVYWKQSLWIGGVYWVLSQCFSVIGTFGSYSVDALLSVLLLVFLLPMNKFCPIKSVDKAMHKMPVLSTFLVSVGWVPYFVGILFVVSTISAFVIAYLGEMMEYRLIMMLNVIAWADTVRRIVFVVMLLVALVFVLITHKSIVGNLDKKYRLINEEAAVEAKKEESVNEATEEVIVEKVQEKKDVKKAPAKKAPIKKATPKKQEAKKTEKVTEEKTVKVKKVEKKAPAKKLSAAKKKTEKKKEA